MCLRADCDNGSNIELVYEPICREFHGVVTQQENLLVQALSNGNSSFQNDTLAPVGNNSKHISAKYGWFEIVIPIISFLGIVGNILNLLVLTRRRMLSSMDRLEKSATYGLVALALSDMLFCLAVFPHTFISSESRSVDSSHAYILYYKLYGIGLVNLFLMVSTWLIVTMSINRYIVVVYPLHARSTLSTFRTTLTIILVYLLSTIVTLPFFVHLTVEPCYGLQRALRYEFRPKFSRKVTRSILFYLQWIWPIVADFVPIGILAFCNTRLIWELRKATSKRKRTAHGQKIRDSSHKVTLTLVIIVLMLLFLVSPSEILRYINPYRSWGNVGHIIAEVTNMLQALNFAFNFILYCVLSAAFRHTFKAMFSRCFKDKGEKTEMHSMLTHGTASIDRTLMTEAELD